jgi:hypothetical protein
VFQTQVRDEEGNVAEKDSLGRVTMRNVTEEEAADRRNYNRSDNISYLDGDEPDYIKYDAGNTTWLTTTHAFTKAARGKTALTGCLPAPAGILTKNMLPTSSVSVAPWFAWAARWLRYQT